MGKVSSKKEFAPSFILAAGDNFYMHGLGGALAPLNQLWMYHTAPSSPESFSIKLQMHIVSFPSIKARLFFVL